MTGELTALVVAVALLAGNAFFVGAEFALISVRRTQLEPRVQAGSRVARLTLRAVERVSLMMAGAQLGITMCSLGLGAVAEPAVARLLEGPFEALGVPAGLVHPVAFAVAMAVVVYLHMVLGEMVPKNLAVAGPVPAALVLGPPLYLLVTILKPAIVVLNAVANGLLRLLRVEPREEVASAFTREEVSALAAESRREGLLDADEYRLLTGALALPESSVRSVLLPLADLDAVPTSVTPADLERAATRTGFSRFPVVDDAGEPVGYLHLKDVLEEDPARRERPVPSERVRPLIGVRPEDTLESALGLMRRHRAHVAAVRGADGRTLGIVALEDVVEELVGEIRDATRRH
ncbi:hemolysin family protein [Actinoalloteichus caeruleus]|uniref:hemolysin family protein n=1 Tax=Actinoalloteichus cyanogriseus TaxID=2893586 RepID=UPI003BB98118